MISFTACLKSVSTRDYNYSLIVTGKRHHGMEHPFPYAECVTNYPHFAKVVIYVHGLYCGLLWRYSTMHLFFFLFPNVLVSNTRQELPGKDLVFVLIRPTNNLSEAATVFLIHLSAKSVLALTSMAHV